VLVEEGWPFTMTAMTAMTAEANELDSGIGELVETKGR
jgi:hypothetical protein